MNLQKTLSVLVLIAAALVGLYALGWLFSGDGLMLLVSLCVLGFLVTPLTVLGVVLWLDSRISLLIAASISGTMTLVAGLLIFKSIVTELQLSGLKNIFTSFMMLELLIFAMLASLFVYSIRRYHQTNSELSAPPNNQ